MRKLGATEREVFPICLGGNVFGWTASEAGSFAVLDAYFAAGGNFVDTADAYSAWAPGNVGGESEEILGRWMASRGNRERVVVATKVGKLAGLAGLSAGTIRKQASQIYSPGQTPVPGRAACTTSGASWNSRPTPCPQNSRTTP